MVLCKTCGKHASFNYENETIAIYCSSCKLENMINIKRKRCLEDNCIVTPTFGYKNKSAQYCKEHCKNL
jgi:hypothetical protein